MITITSDFVRIFHQIVKHVFLERHLKPLKAPPWTRLALNPSGNDNISVIHVLVADKVLKYQKLRYTLRSRKYIVGPLCQKISLEHSYCLHLLLIRYN